MADGSNPGRAAAQDRLAAGRGEGPVGGADAGRAGFGLALAPMGVATPTPTAMMPGFWIGWLRPFRPARWSSSTSGIQHGRFSPHQAISIRADRLALCIARERQ